MSEKLSKTLSHLIWHSSFNTSVQFYDYDRKRVIMAVTLFFATLIFLAVIFLSATFYYRSKVVILQKRLQRMWVDIMLSNGSSAQTEDSIELFFDGKDNQFKPLRIAEEDTNSIIPAVDSVHILGSTPTASIKKGTL